MYGFVWTKAQFWGPGRNTMPLPSAVRAIVDRCPHSREKSPQTERGQLPTKTKLWCFACRGPSTRASSHLLLALSPQGTSLTWVKVSRISHHFHKGLHHPPGWRVLPVQKTNLTLPTGGRLCDDPALSGCLNRSALCLPMFPGRPLGPSYTDGPILRWLIELRDTMRYPSSPSSLW